MRILYWPIDTSLQKEVEENYRTRFAIGLKDNDSLTIMRQLTFDDAAPQITIEAVENLFAYLEKNFLKNKIRGVGMELGAGPAVFSAILAKRPAIKKMYAVEICRNIVELLMPKVVEEIAGDNSVKVVGCIGDFNHLQLEDNSVDFIFDFFSLHHSNNPLITLRECCRVLKKGGFVLALDKARPNNLTNGDIERMLNKEYDEDYKRQFGLSLDQKLTRRDNGEREYRLQDWQYFFEKAGFQNFSCYNLDQCQGRWFWLRTIKNFLAKLPPKIQIYLIPLLPQQRDLFMLSKKNRVFSPLINSFRKEMSLMIGYKQFSSFLCTYY